MVFFHDIVGVLGWKMKIQEGGRVEEICRLENGGRTPTQELAAGDTDEHPPAKRRRACVDQGELQVRKFFWIAKKSIKDICLNLGTIMVITFKLFSFHVPLFSFPGTC